MEDFLPLMPMLVVLVGATVGVVLEGAVSRILRATVQTAWTLLVILLAFVLNALAMMDSPMTLTASAAIAVDGPSRVTWMLLLIFGAMACLLFAERRVGGGASPFAADASAVPSSMAEQEAIAARQEHSEVFPLLLFSIGGMMLFISASDLIVLFVALELFSFPLYVLSGMARRRRLLSQESSLKYFLLGGLSSALFLYGSALVFGYSGGLRYRVIDIAVVNSSQSPWLLLAGVGLVSVGVLFKLGAVPFHNWVPDVYTGAPTAVTGFMAVCTKIAAALGLIRLLYVALGGLVWDWQLAVAVIAVLTMAIGAMVGLVQSDVKRVLAYSSIAHAGFILTAVVGATTVFSGLGKDQIGSVDAVLFYLLAYGFATLGAFAIITLVRRSGSEATSYAAWKGLGRRVPSLGVAMTIFLLSMAGIPLTGGFIGKVLVFMAAYAGGYGWLVLIAVVFSLVAAGFYFRIVWLLFGSDPTPETAVVSPGVGTQVVIWAGVAGSILFGVAPTLALDLVAGHTIFLR